MTNFRQNTTANVNAFVDVTRSEVFIVKPCETINKIENSSFESPEYNDDGTLRQYNWSYGDADGLTANRAYPVTYDHAYSGSFAWKARMTTTDQYIAYGKTRGIQRTSKDNFHDILSFYCYCAEDGPTYSKLNTNEIYVPQIASREVEFILEVYGMTTNAFSTASISPSALYSKTFTLNSLPKNAPGDVDNGLSGTQNPFFYPWTRVELNIPKFDSSSLYPYVFFKISRTANNSYGLYSASGIISINAGSKIVNGTSTDFTPRDIGFKIFTSTNVELGTIDGYTDFHKVHLVDDYAPGYNGSFKFQYPVNDTYFVIDGVQCEEQPTSKKATMYFDGSYEGFNTVRYPKDFQFTGTPYKSTSIRSPFTRVSGEIIDMNDYCNFYTKSIDGLATPDVQTVIHSKTLRDGQHFVEQIIQNGKITISGRIVADTQTSYIDSFAKFQELLGKKPFSDPEPLRIFLRLQFTTGKTLLPVYFDAVYESGLEMDTKTIFQDDVNITFQMISTHIQYQNDSSTNMFNDSPLFDQFNTMQTDMIRNIAGFVYYNKVKEKWESPGGIGFFKLTDTTYTADTPFNNATKYQQYDTKTYYTVGDVNVIKEDKDGVLWIGGRFDMVEFDAYYVDDQNNRIDVRLQVRCNNIVGIRNRQMITNAFVYPELEDFNGKYLANGQTLTLVEAISEWQIIALVDAPTRYTQSNELSPTAFIGIPGSNSTVYAIEFLPNGDMYIGGKFNLTYGGRKIINFCSYKAFGVDATNVSLYKPSLMNQTMYNFVTTNYNETQLQTIQGNGIYRTNWVNSAIPYVKYGTFGDEGAVGDGSNQDSCRTIVYDYANECLYLGGDFVSVRNPDNLTTSIAAYRIARYSPVTQTFLGFVNIGGIVPTSVAYNANIVVLTMAIQYIPSGVALYIGGKWAAVSNNGAGGLAAGTFVNTTSFAMAKIWDVSPTSRWAYQETGGGGDNANPPTIYDILITNDERVYVAGDFTKLNRLFGTYTNVTGIAEFRSGSFLDITRGLEANFYPDNYTAFPSVRSLSSDNQGSLYLVGQFSNIQNRLNVDGIARWDGKNYSGMGIYFPPLIAKTLQKVYVDNNDNILLFTGPNNIKTTLVRTFFTDIQFPASRGVAVIWEKLPYSAFSRKFFADDLDFEFLNISIVDGITSYTFGTVNAVVNCSSSVQSDLPNFTNEDTVFIGGKFTHVRVGDSLFRCNHLVAFRYDINQHPFPYKILTFSNAGSHVSTAPDLSFIYDDMMGFTETSAMLGINASTVSTAGTITALTNNKTVTGSSSPVSTQFQQSDVGGKLYTSNNVLVGTIASVTNANSLNLTANAAVQLSNAPYVIRGIGQVNTIQVVYDTHQNKRFPSRLYVGGKFDFKALSLNSAQDPEKPDSYSSNRIKNLFCIELERNAAGHDMEFNIPSNQEKNISVPYVNHGKYIYIGEVGAPGSNDAVFSLVPSYDFYNGVTSTRLDLKMFFVGGDFVQTKYTTSTTGLSSALPTRRIAILPYESFSTNTVKHRLCHVTTSISTGTATGADTATATYSPTSFVKDFAYTNWMYTTANQDTQLVVGGRFTSLKDDTTTLSMNAIGRYVVLKNNALSTITVDTFDSVIANNGTISYSTANNTLTGASSNFAQIVPGWDVYTNAGAYIGRVNTVTSNTSANFLYNATATQAAPGVAYDICKSGLDLAGYLAGTVTVTANSATVTGSGTNFSLLSPGYQLYTANFNVLIGEVLSITSATSLTLLTPSSISYNGNYAAYVNVANYGIITTTSGSVNFTGSGTAFFSFATGGATVGTAIYRSDTNAFLGFVNTVTSETAGTFAVAPSVSYTGTFYVINRAFITTSTSSTTVTGINTDFDTGIASYTLTNGNIPYGYGAGVDLYTDADVYIGTIKSVTNFRTATLVNNAAVTVTNARYKIKANMFSANNLAAPVINSLLYNNIEKMFIAGDFRSGVQYIGTSNNVSRLIGFEDLTYAYNGLPFVQNQGFSYTLGAAVSEYLYNGTLGLPFGVSKVVGQNLSGCVTFAGVSSGSTNNLFPDATVINYNATASLIPANYAYAAPNITQSLVSVLTSEIAQPNRKLMQAPTTDVGVPFELQTAITPFSISVPYHNTSNSLYNAVIMQEFNCYNTGSTSVYPTITLYCPYKPTLYTSAYYHVINNVTTKQSIYLALTMSANEVIRIRTERDRISVISNYRGDITNAIINSRNFSLSNNNDAQIFRLIPGKNVITYGPSFPMQRYFYEDEVVDITYNLNMNVVVPPVILSLSWSIGFNSIYDANATEINPLLLL